MKYLALGLLVFVTFFPLLAVDPTKDPWFIASVHSPEDPRFLSLSDSQKETFRFKKAWNVLELLETTYDVSIKFPSLARVIDLDKKLVGINEDNLKNLILDLSWLPNFKRAFLQKNKLTSIPTEIRFLKNLTGIYLNWNDLEELPYELGELHKLARLEVKHNKLKRLPPSPKFQTTLKYTWISGNPIEELPGAVLHFFIGKKVSFKDTKKLEELIPEAQVPYKEVGSFPSLLHLSLKRVAEFMKNHSWDDAIKEKLPRELREQLEEEIKGKEVTCSELNCMRSFHRHVNHLEKVFKAKNPGYFCEVPGVNFRIILCPKCSVEVREQERKNTKRVN